MARLGVAPTRSNLLRMHESLEMAREGHEILDRKREVLTTELMHIAHEAAQLQQRVWELLADAYRALEMARLSMGREPWSGRRYLSIVRLKWTSGPRVSWA